MLQSIHHRKQLKTVSWTHGLMTTRKLDVPTLCSGEPIRSNQMYQVVIESKIILERWYKVIRPRCVGFRNHYQTNDFLSWVLKFVPTTKSLTIGREC
jgi:hypothetical protein